MHRRLAPAITLFLAIGAAGCADRNRAAAAEAGDRLPAFLLDSYPHPATVRARTSIVLSPTVLKIVKREVGAAKSRSPIDGFPEATITDTPFGDGGEPVPEPAAEHVARWLLGQQFVYSRDLFGTARRWTVEPGEIARIEVGAPEFDARRRSWTANLIVELVDKGCGLELEGPLRYYVQPTVGGGAVQLHDFTPTRRRRFGRCD